MNADGSQKSEHHSRSPCLHNNWIFAEVLCMSSANDSFEPRLFFGAARLEIGALIAMFTRDAAVSSYVVVK
jgi:hypothetical protein